MEETLLYMALSACQMIIEPVRKVRELRQGLGRLISGMEEMPDVDHGPAAGP